MSHELRSQLDGWLRALRAWYGPSPRTPRLFFDESGPRSLRAKRDDYAAQWDALRRSAESDRTADIPTHNDPALALRSALGRAKTMALVGLVDERDDLCRDLWRYVEATLGEEPIALNWVMDAHLPLRVDLGYAGMCATLACVLDWAGHTWTEEQRQRVRRELAARVALYHEIGAAESEWWSKSTHNWRSVICGEMGVAALAVAEYVPNLHDVLSLSIEGVNVVLNTEGDDGSHTEGVGYWGYGVGMAAWFARSLKACTRGAVDLFEHPYMRVTGDYALYISTPDGTCFGYEDCRPQAPTSWLCALLAAEYRNPAYQWVAQLAGVPSGVEGFLFSDPSLEPVPPAELPTTHLFPDIDTGTSRSGWEPSATFVGVHAGRTTVNHAHLDIGTIWLVSRGARLIGDAGVWPYDHGEFFFNGRGPRWDYEANATIGHNTLLVNGFGQTYATDCAGTLTLARSDADTDVYIVDGAGAYGGRLSRFVRIVAYVKPDIVVIRDDIASAEPAQFQWLLHPEGEVDVQDTRWRVVNGAARLTVDILGFERLGRGDGYRVSISERTTRYHDRVDSPVTRLNRVLSFETLHPVKSWRVTAVLRVGGTSDADPPKPVLDGMQLGVSDGDRRWSLAFDGAGGVQVARA